MFVFFSIMILTLLLDGYFFRYFLPKRWRLSLTYLQTVLSVTFIYYFYREQATPLVRMLLLISTLFLSMKTVVYAHSSQQLSIIQWICFACFWIGMNPAILLEKHHQKTFPANLLKTALFNIVIGSGLLLAASWNLSHHLNFYLSWALTLMGFSMVFHFGGLNLLVVVWRLFGYNVSSPFHSPLKSSSLASFWGRDWNIPYVEMTTTAIYRPALRALGANGALLLTFFISGVFHEIAITLPVHAGFGRPMCFFLIQGGLVALERWLKKKKPHWLKAHNKIYLYAAVVLPLPLVFPPTFVKEVLFPLVNGLF